MPHPEKVTRAHFLRGLPALLAPAPPAGAAETYRLENRLIRIQLRAGPDGAWIEELAVNREAGRPGAGFTANLCPPNPGAPFLRSCTAMLVEGLPWQFSRIATRAGTRKTASTLRLEDVLIGPENSPLAREAWMLELTGDRLVWRIERTFLREARVICDRFPALTFVTVASGPRGRVSFGEIPGFLDPDMLLDGTRGFDLLPPDGKWFEMLSPNLIQEIHLAPSGLALASDLETGWFSYAKPPADGTARYVSLGAETADRRAGVAARPAGALQRQTWSLRLKANAGPAPFELTLPDAFLTAQSRSFAAVHNQWMGWMFANNPASAAIPHEMAWYPMIQSLYGRNARFLAALGRQLAFIAEAGVESTGYVLPRWASGGFYRVVWGNLHDQIPHFILAMYFHAVNTGSREFLRRRMPVLDRVARYLLALDSDHDGVPEIPNTSGLPTGERDCSNWYDIVKFGHKDAIIAAYGCGALGAMAEMNAWLGDKGAAEAYRSHHRRAVEGFNNIFWDENAGYYLDWIDVRGLGRRYFYTDQNLLAIVFGMADAARAERIVSNLDRRYEALCRDHKLAREAIWATPCNMLPVTQFGDLVQFGVLQNQKVYPNYENGCSFFHTTGFEIAARGLAGQPEEAYAAFERVIRHGYASNRLWAAALKWDTGELISEPLNNALLILWGFARGCLGVWPTLEECTIRGKPSPRLEGARYTFCHLGRDVTVEVRNGQTKVVKP